MLIDTITRDISQDKYGDLIFNGSDIVTSYNKDEIAKMNAANRVFSANGDLFKYKLYGANLINYIGKQLTDETIDEMARSIRQSLTSDLFLSAYEIMIVPVRNGVDSVYFKISVGTSEGFTREKVQEINIEFTTTGGVRYV